VKEVNLFLFLFYFYFIFIFTLPLVEGQGRAGAWGGQEQKILSYFKYYLLL
jgi:hypothetical protein